MDLTRSERQSIIETALTQTSTRRRYARMGERFQRFVTGCLQEWATSNGLPTASVCTGNINANGLDVRLTPEATGVLGDLRIEVKSGNSVPLRQAVREHAEKHADGVPMLVYQDGKEAYVVQRLSDYIQDKQVKVKTTSEEPALGLEGF